MTDYLPIEEHGLIGDMHTTALVAPDGTIDFLCWPRFDSPSIFAALLDSRRGGSFRIFCDSAEVHRRQFYLPDTNVLVTRHLSDQGALEICDFMPPVDTGCGAALVRRVRAVRGAMQGKLRLAPRFDYARQGHRLDLRGKQAIFHGGDGTTLRLLSEIDLDEDAGDVVATFELCAGQGIDFVFETVGESPYEEAGRLRHDATEAAFDATVRFWRRWIARCQYTGRWREEVNRSALVLKLMQSAQHGSLIAAATFGLPEKIGSDRNWDYRYAWVRDAAFTVSAFSQLGFHDEMHHFVAFLADRCVRELDRRDQPLQVLYGVGGETDLHEETLDHLEGYRGSSPVRIGNAAEGQLQLDMYGELMNALYLYCVSGYRITHDLWAILCDVLDWVCDAWTRPDDGIWEIRGDPKHFLQSKVMCWSALERGLKIATMESLPAGDRWLRTRDEIYHHVFDRYWNDAGYLTQFPDSTSTDASLLTLPLVDFISPADPRWLSTMQYLESRLVEDSYVYRNLGDIDDSLDVDEKSVEGSFSICTFWWVQCLAQAGRIDEARLHFEKMLGCANHVGLFAEQLGRRLEHLGNFPQAFTHLGLINAALDLDRRITEEALQPGIKHRRAQRSSRAPTVKSPTDEP